MILIVFPIAIGIHLPPTVFRVTPILYMLPPEGLAFILPSILRVDQWAPSIFF